MKYIHILHIVLFISLVACNDADSKMTRTPAQVTIDKGTRFILYSSVFQTLDTIVVHETRVLDGTISVEKGANKVGYSINGMKYKFNTYNSFDNIYFNFDNDNLSWIGSRSINSNFVYENMTMKLLDIKNLEIEFSGDKPTKSFGISSNPYHILIEGRMSFNQKQ